MKNAFSVPKNRISRVRLARSHLIGEQSLFRSEKAERIANALSERASSGKTPQMESVTEPREVSRPAFMLGTVRRLVKDNWFALYFSSAREIQIIQPLIYKRHFSNGFTLIELMIVVAITAILASIALPSYQESVYRSKMRTAQQDLVGMSLHLENAFNRALAYPSTTNTGAKTKEAIPGWSPSSEEANFVFLITASSATAYTVTAEGAGQMSGCNITLTQANVRATTGCSQGGGSWM